MYQKSLNLEVWITWDIAVDIIIKVKLTFNLKYDSIYIWSYYSNTHFAVIRKNGATADWKENCRYCSLTGYWRYSRSNLDSIEIADSVSGARLEPFDRIFE